MTQPAHTEVNQSHGVNVKVTSWYKLMSSGSASPKENKHTRLEYWAKCIPNLTEWQRQNRHMNRSQTKYHKSKSKLIAWNKNEKTLAQTCVHLRIQPQSLLVQKVRLETANSCSYWQTSQCSLYNNLSDSVLKYNLYFLIHIDFHTFFTLNQYSAIDVSQPLVFYN